jgi:hypothetical protein
MLLITHATFPRSIKEFQELYKKEFNKEISKEEAEKRGEDLLEAYRLIANPSKN